MDASQASTAASDFGGVTIRINLDAVRRNYRKLADLGSAECAAAVKGDAYGLGVKRVAPALHAEGCRSFFVAQLGEAAELIALLDDIEVFVLNGLAPSSAPAFAELGAVPVLTNPEEIAEWAAFANERGAPLPSALHVDTGINRLGLTLDDVAALAARGDLLEALDWRLLMSHFACADTPDDPMNALQIERFEAARTLLPAMPASMANSAAALSNPASHYDILRPGIALYGGNPFADRANPMNRVVTVQATVLQVRDVAAGESVGYGATWRAERASRIAVLPIGYCDGFFRLLGGSNDATTAEVWIGGHFAPVAGRVSMDMITVDVTHIPADLVGRGTSAEIFGEHVRLGEFAGRAGTISYEVLTSLGARCARIYETARDS